MCNGDCIESGSDIWAGRFDSKKWIEVECVGISLSLTSHWKEAVHSFPMIYNMSYIDKNIGVGQVWQSTIPEGLTSAHLASYLAMQKHISHLVRNCNGIPVYLATTL